MGQSRLLLGAGRREAGLQRLGLLEHIRQNRLSGHLERTSFHHHSGRRTTATVSNRHQSFPRNGELVPEDRWAVARLNWLERLE
eukprot:7015642-Pyramimonas_sp.AAC.1